MEFSQKPNSIKQPDRNYNNHLPNPLHPVGGDILRLTSPTPTKANNPCPVCGSTKPDCRTLITHAVFCKTYANARLREVINGYICTKEQGNGHTATFMPYRGEWSEEQKREHKTKQLQRQQLKAKQKKELQGRLPTIPQRDQGYSKLANQLKLNHHHKHLRLEKNRGLTAQEIDFAYENGWIRSWQPGLPVEDIPQDLAGFNSRGFDKKLVSVSGISIAATDGNGHIVGHQIASDDRKNLPKYIWVSSNKYTGITPHLPNGELPLFTWRHPDGTQIKETWIVEGSLKSLILALKAWFRWGRKDVQVIGAAGGQFYGSPQTLMQALTKQTTEKVVLFPDAGSLLNHNVLTQYKKLGDLLALLEYDFNWAWWEQYTKNDLDADELTNLNDVIYLTPLEVSEIIKEQKAKQLPWELWGKQRKFTPDVVVCQDEFDFGDIPANNAIIAAKSDLSTGKTKCILRQIAAIEKALRRRGLLNGYRNNLLLQTGNRGDKFDIKIYHIQVDDGIKLVADDTAHLAFCLDSAHKVDGYFKGADLYLDEACGVLLHAVNGGTLGADQARALKVFSSAVRAASRVFLLDGNLSDLFVDFIAKIDPTKQVVRIENTKRIKPHTFTIVDGIDFEKEVKKRDKSALIAKMCEDGVTPWIFSDSKKFTLTMHEILSAQGKRGYVLNSETTNEKWAKEFLENPNEFIRKYKPDYIIISPTAESGISVEINGYFTDKFSFFCGVQSTNSQRQALFRLRDGTIPHYVFCPEKSMVKDRNTPYEYSAKKIKEIIEQRIAKSMDLAAFGDQSESAKDIIAKALSRSDDLWFELSCQLTAIDNFEQNNLRECLIRILREYGHKVEIVQWEWKPDYKNLEKAARDKVDSTEASELEQAEPLPSVEIAIKKSKSSPNKDVQRQIEKTFLIDKLPGIDNSDIWGHDFILKCHIKNKNYFSQINKYWLLRNYSVSQIKHEVETFHEVTRDSFYKGRISNNKHNEIWGLNELNILQFENLDYYHKNTPEVINTINTLRERRDLQIALNMTQLEPPKQDNSDRLRILHKLLERAGLKNKYLDKRITEAGIRLRHYKCNPLDVLIEKSKEITLKTRQTILDIYETKFKNWLTSKKSQVDWNSQIDAQVETQPELHKHNSLPADEPLNYQEADLRQIGEDLQACENQETYNLLASSYPSSIVEAALKTVNKIKSQVKQDWGAITQQCRETIRNCGANFGLT